MARKPRSDSPAQANPYIRFSANCLIGGAAVAAIPGDIVRVRGSVCNDGDFRVIEAGDYWLRVSPHVHDELPCAATVTVLEPAA